jgi:hypothetical protein
MTDKLIAELRDLQARTSYAHDASEQSRTVYDRVIAEVERLQSEVMRLVGSWNSAVANYGIQKRERERVEGEVRNFESRIHGQRLEITRLAAEVSRLTAERDAAREDARRWHDIQPVLNFLQGVSPLEGVHFGDRHPTRKGLYWWRRAIDSVRGVPEYMTQEGEGEQT